MNKIIDLRSDTVTRPSPAMRKAMMSAEVGDDVFGDDPTVNLLQEKVAALVGKEASLFVPSGTMANLISILTHTHPGDEVIMEKESHTFNYEVGGAAVLAGVQINPLIGKRGILEKQQIEDAIRTPNVHIPQTSLICLENTHNRGSGAIYPLDKIREISHLARARGLKLHLDGARLFNASVATGISVREYASYFDSLMFCFSKGLGAPVGSIIAGSKEFIIRAHRWRKMLGGGMRQIGILAAAALYALEFNVERLAEDHLHAKLLAQTIEQLPGFSVNAVQVETNIIVFDVAKSGLSVAEVLRRLKAQGVLMVDFGATQVRAVTSLEVNRADIEKTITILQHLFG